MAPPKGYTPWNKGLTKKDDPRISTATGNQTWKGRNHKAETRVKMSQSRTDLYAAGWEPVCGRCKKYDYVSPIAGKIKLDGTWELIAARYLDSLGVSWVRNRKRFPYIKPDGRPSTYQPDFFVKEWDSYVEVKGYQTELDDAKWAQFPYALQVWKKDKIREIGDVAEPGLLHFPAKEAGR